MPKNEEASEFASDVVPDPNMLIPNPIYPKDPGPITPTTEKTLYITLIEQKLILARDFILKEIELDLDSNRNMQKDETAMLLAEPPILFSLYCQESIRDVVKLRCDIAMVMRDGIVGGSEEEELRGKFDEAWREVKVVVTILMPGNSQALKEERAESAMVNAFG